MTAMACQPTELASLTGRSDALLQKPEWRSLNSRKDLRILTKLERWLFGEFGINWQVAVVDFEVQSRGGG